MGAQSKRWSASLTSVVMCTATLFLGCSREQATQPTTASKAPPRRKRATVVPVSLEAVRDAALKGEVETVRKGIEQGVDVNVPDSEGRTTLQLASFDGHVSVVRLLLSNEPIVDHRDGSGRTALMYAASGSNQETVSILLEAGADPNTVDSEEGFTALMFAAAEGQLEVARTLLGHGADATLSDIDGDTALDFASQNSHTDLVQLLSQ